MKFIEIAGTECEVRDNDITTTKDLVVVTIQLEVIVEKLYLQDFAEELSSVIVNYETD